MVALWLAELQDELRNVDPRVREHVVRERARSIAAARKAGDDARAALAEAGDPLDIAADVRERHGVRERSSWRELAAIVLLPFGGVVIPVAGWFGALYFLWTSPVWTTREKLGATLVLPGGTLLPFLLLSRSAWYAAALVAPLGTAAYLAVRLRG